MHAEALALSRNFLTLEDVALLKHIARNLPSNGEVVDVGCGAGTTAIAILEENENIAVVSFDISQANLDWTQQAVTNLGYADRWDSVCINATEAAANVDITVPAVLLDASHLYEDTLAELIVWVPLIERGGWIWCHDYAGDGGMPPGENGVKRAVDEYVADVYPDTFEERIERGRGIALRLR